jgi:hypothetical protein
MSSPTLPGLLRPVSTFAIVVGILSATPSHAQTSPTVYGACSYTLSTVIHVSNVFSAPQNQIGQAGAAFQHYALQHAGATNAHCSWAPSADSLNNQIKQLESRTSAPNSPLKIVNDGWSYTPTAAAAPQQQHPYGANQQNQQARAYSAQNAAYAPPAQAQPYNTAQNNTPQNSTNTAAGSASNMGSSIGSSITSAGVNAKQSVQSSATDAVTGSVNNATSSATQMINGGMTNLQNRLFHHGNKNQQQADQAAAVPATAAAATPAAPATAAVATPAAMLPAGAASAASAVADKPTIVDEGDGKHAILTLPGQSDAHELTLVAGTKNVYLEESTGDKYIVLPSGDIKHIPHNNASK